MNHSYDQSFDCGYAKFSTQECVVAKKQHVCSVTKQAILPGDKYYRHFGKFDGNTYFFKVSVPAQDFIRTFQLYGHDWADLRSFVHEMKNDDDLLRSSWNVICRPEDIVMKDENE